MNTVSLSHQLKIIENYIPYHKKVNLKQSKVSVGWHLYHSLKVINTVVSVMKKSDPKEYNDNFKFLGKVLLAFNYFPKGKAKAPKQVNITETILEETILEQLKTVNSNLETLKSLPKNAFFVHPLFGNVNKVRVCKFFKTHTNHHLKIIESILK